MQILFNFSTVRPIKIVSSEVLQHLLQKNTIFVGVKQLLAVILAMLVLGAVVPGCSDVPRYDSRLTVADSLMHDNPDSALAIIEAVNRDSLTTEHDRAYRDLLLTQARYKAYIPATSDSDINRALSYYKQHPKEREKLTRAYLYKGAVMEELGYPDSAMFYYKQAESTASPDDYFNLGYVKMRMGALYRDQHTMDGKHIEKYEEALECFKSTDNNHYQLVCMINLGSLYCLKAPHKADSVLSIALTLAEQIDDKENYVGAIQNLIKNDVNRGRYNHARGLIMKVMSMDNPVINIPFCLYAAQTYACLQIPDSAELFLSLIGNNPIIDNIDRISFLEAKGDIALARKDTSVYLLMKSESKRIADSLQSLSTPLSIITTEDRIDRQSHLSSELSRQITANWNVILALMIMLILTVSLFIFIRRKKSHEKQLYQVKQILDSSESQLSEMRLSLENLSKLNIRESKLKVFLDSYMSLTRDMMEECYHQPDLKQTKKIKEVIKFQKNNKDEWEKLYGYIDLEYNGIISKTKDNYPQLNDKDLLLIALSAMDFSCMQIAIILGYSNQTSVGTIRKRLCEKMNIEGSLNDYISHFK